MNKFKSWFNKVQKDESDICIDLSKEYEVPAEVEELAEDLSGGYWNYRFVEKEYTWKDKDDKSYYERYYELHEIYYKADGTIWAWTENPVDLSIQSLSELKDLTKKIKTASRHTILKLIKKDNDEDEMIRTNKKLKDIKEKDLSNYNIDFTSWDNI